MAPFDMFALISTNSLLPFINSVELGKIKFFPSLRYCVISFTTHYYHDELFEKWRIPFPNQLNMAVVKRKAEYLAVRYAAKKIIKSFGCDGTPGMAPDRSPVWPPGWCGSLSHSLECAIAVVTPDESGLRPGIDIEFLAPATMQQTAHLFTSPDEQEYLANIKIDYSTALLIAFSAKESLFKAFYPEVGSFFNFDAARICKIEILEHRITFELTQTLTCNHIIGSHVQGYYNISEGRVITLIA